jgi:flagellar biosynthesis/type III secretory pathway M-ring protein FliF/YscJ
MNMFDNNIMLWVGIFLFLVILLGVAMLIRNQAFKKEPQRVSKKEDVAHSVSPVPSEKINKSEDPK